MIEPVRRNLVVNLGIERAFAVFEVAEAALR